MVTVATVFSDTKDMKLHVLFNSSTDHRQGLMLPEYSIV
jgi:hypothetical protein